MAVLSVGLILAFRPVRNEDHSIEGMFAMDDQLYESYQTLKRTFGGSEVVLIVYHDSKLMEEAGQRRQKILCQKLDQVAGVSGSAISLQKLLEMIRSFKVERLSYLLRFAGFDLSTPMLIDQAKSLFQGFTHSRDEKTAAILVLLQPRSAGLARRNVVADLREAVRRAQTELDFTNEILLVGEPVMVADGFRMVQADGVRLGWVATIALSLVVLIAFRSIRWTLIPAAVVQFSLLANESIIALLKIQVTIVGSMSTSIITVIAVSTTIHLIIRIRRNMENGLTYHDACEQSFHQLAVPITFACLTDAVGFGALWFAELEPVQDFATVMFTGSLLVLLAFWFLAPFLSLFRFADGLPFWNLRPAQTGLLSAFSRGLNFPLQLSQRYPYVILAITLGLVVFSIIGIGQNQIESDFTKNFRTGSKIVKSYQFVEENLGGAGVWDIMVKSPERLDVTFLKKIKRLQDRLRSEVFIEREDGRREPGLTKVLSLLDAIEAFSNKPVDQLKDSHITVGMSLFETQLPQFKSSLLSEDSSRENQSYFRIMLRSRERTKSSEKRQVIRQVNDLCEAEFGARDGQRQYECTGFYVLLTYMIDSIIRDQWRTFGIAAAGIILMLVVSLRDVRLALVGLIPNLLPIFCVLGFLGWAQIPLNLGIALIAAVAIGLSIDSSIHYIYDFQTKKKTMETTKALASAQEQVGRALIYSTLALVIGFMSLCFSDFLPTVYFGATAMIAMAGGLIGNLFLLPLFVSLTFKAEMRSAKQLDASSS